MPPPTPKKAKSEGRTTDPEPMEGLTPVKPGYITPKKQPVVGSPDYSPAEVVDLGKDLTEKEKSELAGIGSRQEKLQKDLATAMKGTSRRKHKKSKKTRKTRKAKKHGKRKA